MNFWTLDYIEDNRKLTKLHQVNTLTHYWVVQCMKLLPWLALGKVLGYANERCKIVLKSNLELGCWLLLTLKTQLGLCCCPFLQKVHVLDLYKHMYFLTSNIQALAFTQVIISKKIVHNNSHIIYYVGHCVVCTRWTKLISQIIFSFS